MLFAQAMKNLISGSKKSPFKKSLSAITLTALTMKSQSINS